MWKHIIMIVSFDFISKEESQESEEVTKMEMLLAQFEFEYK